VAFLLKKSGRDLPFSNVTPSCTFKPSDCWAEKLQPLFDRLAALLLFPALAAIPSHVPSCLPVPVRILGSFRAARHGVASMLQLIGRI
jgi:hypothetical protein